MVKNHLFKSHLLGEGTLVDGSPLKTIFLLCFYCAAILKCLRLINDINDMFHVTLM